MKELIQAALAEVNVCLPGVIVAYDGKTATVRPAMPKQLANGQTLSAPQIVQVPVCWPIADGGRAMVTVPLKPGDPVKLNFSQRSLENWLSGSDQAPDDPRQFDLSDCFATPVMRPGPVADTENVCIQYGPGTIKLAPSGDLTINVPTMTVNSQTNTFNAEQTTFNSKVTVNGLLTYTAGLSGSGGGAGTTIEGGANFTGGAITHDGKVIDSTHKHDGVTPGGGQTGEVV
ncbi:MAG: Gp138 family membrane-puncturing spike protein [Castellaniella sp.]|uniref:Gp138 family membrane-puncturing spike protein n=1 Tax=Castellaniella sp. TaxID=1955812 RepID=UPI003C765FF4